MAYLGSYLSSFEAADDEAVSAVAPKSLAVEGGGVRQGKPASSVSVLKSGNKIGRRLIATARDVFTKTVTATEQEAVTPLMLTAVSNHHMGIDVDRPMAPSAPLIDPLVVSLVAARLNSILEEELTTSLDVTYEDAQVVRVEEEAQARKEVPEDGSFESLFFPDTVPSWLEREVLESGRADLGEDVSCEESAVVEWGESALS